MKEAELRDIISENIEVLEKGLVLLEKERYIPNSLGTNGFVDLYARDEKGNHVIIELKKSKGSSREAIHEVIKYVEGVKGFLGVKNEEIRVIVASTDWSELLIPLSRFVQDSKIYVLGLQIEIDEFGKIKTSHIDWIDSIRGRAISPFQEICLYKDEKTLNQGIQSIEKVCQYKGIENYVILVMRLNDKDYLAQSKQTICVTDFENGGDREVGIPVYRYLVNFAMQKLSIEEYLKILALDPDMNEEIEEILSMDNDEEEILVSLHDLFLSLEPQFYADHEEIGYPSKINAVFEEDSYKLERVQRYGFFEKNNLLSDDTIISEILGQDGETKQKLKKSVDVSNRAQMAAIREKVKWVLEYNVVWKHNFLRCLDDIELEFPESNIDVSIYNPSTGIFTIYNTLTQKHGSLYIPSYYIIVHNPEPVRMYFGGLTDNGRMTTFDQILKKYYMGDLTLLLFHISCGAQDYRDVEIKEDMGCMYRSYYCTLKDREQEFFFLDDNQWKYCDPLNPLEEYKSYLENHAILAKQIVKTISERYYKS